MDSVRPSILSACGQESSGEGMKTWVARSIQNEMVMHLYDAVNGSRCREHGFTVVFGCNGAANFHSAVLDGEIDQSVGEPTLGVEASGNALCGFARPRALRPPPRRSSGCQPIRRERLSA